VVGDSHILSAVTEAAAHSTRRSHLVTFHQLCGTKYPLSADVPLNTNKQTNLLNYAQITHRFVDLGFLTFCIQNYIVNLLTKMLNLLEHVLIVTFIE
jgi:hypothetical protein